MNVVRHAHRLILRFAIFNLAAVALLGAAWHVGWVDQVIAADVTHLVFVIFGVFLLGTVLCARRVWWVSSKLDGGVALSTAALSSRIAVVRQTANSLVLLGLIGTVLGFIIALGGVDPASADDFDAVAPMVAGLIAGMSVALYTTLVGSVLSLWLTVNYRMLATGAMRLVDDASP